MNIKTQRVAAKMFAMVFMVFSDFAAFLKSNSSKFIHTPRKVKVARCSVSCPG